MSRQSPDLDAIAQAWWKAWEAAQSALNAGGRYLSAQELSERRRRLGEERGAVVRLLQGLTRDLGADSWFITYWLSAPAATSPMLGLPTAVIAGVFDLDGVLTASARLHAAAWAESFNPFLLKQAERGGLPFVPFNRGDYQHLITGRPRLDGVRAFFASRGISLPEGNPDDPPGTDTVYGVANRKNVALQRRLDYEGVSAYAGSRSYLEAARMIGLRTAVVSASVNTAIILERAGLAD